MGAGATPLPDIPSTFATPRALSPEDLQAAIRFRMKVGFRSDADYILRVAADPSSQSGLFAYGTPLLPEERAELDRRAQNGQALIEVVETYGAAHADEWAGAYLDTHTGDFVALFTDSINEHEASIRSRVSPEAQIVVRKVRWTYEELRVRQPRITSDVAWFESIGARYQGIGIGVIENAVTVKVSSGDPDAPRQIIEHFDGSDWLVVDSDGIGQWEGAYGSAAITVLTRSGPAEPALLCRLWPDVPSAVLNDEILTGFDGLCRVKRLPATGYSVEVQALPDDGSPWQVVGRGRLIVEPDAEARLTIQTDLP